ncbi:hypothetical protein BBP40_000016 [Aspergillus hancockii]|nr:hypothetical protein BBP40_000016 [Aspergillus hancockii]
MHWTSLLTVLTLNNIPTTTALSAARVRANFSPTCPADNHSSYPEDPNLPLSEEYTTAVNIVANKCEEIAVPLRYNLKTDHISIEADLFRQDTLDQCNITVWELPGCSAGPVISKELRHEKAFSECQKRHFAAFTQVWLKLECERARPVHHGLASWYHGRLSNGTEGGVNGTTGLNSTDSQGSDGNSLRRMWERRRWRLLPL